MVRPIPEGYHSISPYLIVNDASAAIDFYTAVFGARERMRMADPSGRIGHAEIDIGDSVVMLSDEHPEMDLRGPDGGVPPVSLQMYVENVDKVVQQARAAGVTVERELRDEFYGDRTATLRDPFGHRWHVATHIRDVSEEEMRQAMAAMASQ
jgi:PhnB protein